MIGKKALKSTIFVSAYTYLSFILTFVSNVFLARLLDPEHFGIYALALFFVELVGRVRELGLDQALTHRQGDLERSYRAHFTMQALLYFAALLVTVIAFPWLSRLYGRQLALIVLCLSSLILFQSLSSTPRIYLEKQLAFGRTVLVDSFALIGSVVLSILLAWQGWGVWSLVWGNGFKVVFTFFGLFLASGWRPGLLWDKVLLGWFFKFGGILWLGGLATFVLFKYNDFILGTFISQESLGFYAKAMSLAILPTSLVTSAISRVSFPMYAQLQENKKKLNQALNLVVSTILRVGIPICLLLLITSKELILVVFGQKWLPMVGILRLLVGYSILRCVFDDVGAFLTAQGQPQLTVRYLCAQAVVFLGLAPFLVKWWGVSGGIAALNLVMFFGVIAAYYYAHHFVKFSPLVLFGNSTLAVVISLGAYFLLSELLLLDDWSAPLLLIVKTTLFGVVYLGALWLVEGKRVKADLLFFYRKWRGLD